MANEETNNSYKLTKDQTATLKSIDELIAATKEKHTNPMLASKDITKYAQSLSGSPNEPKRIAMLSALLGCSPDKLNKTKCGVVNLGLAIMDRYIDSPTSSVDVFIKDKEPKVAEPTESETALQSAFKESVVVSDAIRALDVADMNKVNAAAHASFQTAVRRLSTKENPIPRAAVDFTSFLIGASGGNIGSFDLSDAFIAESQGVSTKTVQRGRAQLIEWMAATGKGIIDIKQHEAATKKGTTYKVNLLESTTKIMYSLLNSEHSNADALLTVAGLTGRLLTEGSEVLAATVTKDEFAAAQTMDTMLSEAVDTLGKPKVSLQDAGKGRSASATEKRLEKLGNQIETGLENVSGLIASDQIDAAGKEAAKQQGVLLEKLSSDYGKARKANEKDGSTIDFDAFAERLETINTALVNVSKVATQQAKEALEANKASAAPLSPAQQAKEYIDMLVLPEQVEDERENREADFTEACYFLAEIAGRSTVEGHSNSEFLRLDAILQAAFKVGQHKAAAPAS